MIRNNKYTPARNAKTRAAILVAALATIVTHSHLVVAATAPASDCQRPNQNVYAVLQGYDLSGINVIVDPASPNYAKRQVLDMTCYDNKTYVDGYDNKTYDLPDQLLRPQEPDTINILDGTFLGGTTDSIKEDIAANFGLKVFRGLASANGHFQESGSALLQDKVFFGYNYGSVYAYDVATHPVDARPDVMRLSKDAQALVDKLPGVLTNESWPAHKEFFELYGTHYPSRAKLGCRFQQIILNGMGKLDLEGEAKVHADMAADWLFVLHMMGAVDAGGSGATKNYLNVTSTVTECLGGAEVCPDSRKSFNDYSRECPKHAIMLKPQFEPTYNLIQNKTKRENMQKASKNYFDRQFLKHEVIPLMKVSKAVVSGPLASHDSGGLCGAPAVCPSPYSSQNGHEQYCDGRVLGSNFCHGNPVYGPTQDDMDAKVAQVTANKTNLSKRIQAVSDQAATMLKTNLVNEEDIGWLLVEYASIMSTLQAEIEEETCGWTFDCRTAWEGGTWDWGWHNEEGPHTQYTSRKFTYIKGLL